MTYVLTARVLSEMFHLSHLWDFVLQWGSLSFFSWTKHAFTCHIVWKVSLPPATELLFLFFMLCLMKNNFFLLKCRLLLWPRKKNSLDEFGNEDAALRKWVSEFDYKWCLTTVIWNLSRHTLGQTKPNKGTCQKWEKEMRCSFTLTSVFCCTTVHIIYCGQWETSRVLCLSLCINSAIKLLVILLFC